MKKCMHCGYNTESVLVTFIDAAEVRTLCPNCFTAAVMAGDLKFETNYDLVDDITGLPGAVKFDNKTEHYTLAPRTMLRLLAHDLRAHEWKALVAKYGEQYMLHDDFYTEEGNPWQPATNIPVYEWWDVVEINGKHYCEAFEISGEMDTPEHYQIDDFLEQVARKHNVDVDDVRTYMMDNISFNPKDMKFGAECCGCWIDGVPEWCIDEDNGDGEYDD